LLSDGTGITGVIDVNPPVLAGNRAFDLATMLFYCCDYSSDLLNVPWLFPAVIASSPVPSVTRNTMRAVLCVSVSSRKCRSLLLESN